MKKMMRPVKLKNRKVRAFCTGPNSNIDTEIRKNTTKRKINVEILLSI